MNKVRLFLSLILMSLLATTLACGLFTAASKSEPTTPVKPITLGNDPSGIDVCAAIPQEDIEAVMGRKLASKPEAFNLYDTPSTSGCAYDAGTDSNKNAYFGYVVFTPIDEYNNQPLFDNMDVSGLGQAAYFNNGADARQLWVKVNDKIAFVVAFGDTPNEDGAKAIAKLILAAIK